MNLSTVFAVVIPILLLSYQASSAALNAETKEDVSLALGDTMQKRMTPEESCKGECKGAPDCDMELCIFTGTAIMECEKECEGSDPDEYDENYNTCEDRCYGPKRCKYDCDREHDDPADQAKCMEECVSDYI